VHDAALGSIPSTAFIVSENVGTKIRYGGGFIRYKPYAPLVFRDLREMGLCKKVDEMLDFETVSKVLGKYGVTCKLADS
jgi:hypothetical protein